MEEMTNTNFLQEIIEKDLAEGKIVSLKRPEIQPERIEDIFEEGE
mgnify:CR=1 FL=1